MKITLIGLGVAEGDLTLKAKNALDNAGVIIARTEKCEGFKSLKGYAVRTLDGVYSGCRNFDTLNKKLASEVLKTSKENEVCYCVDGSVCEDEGCKIILSKHKDCAIVDGVSKASHIASLANLKKSGVCGISAYAIDGLKSCRAAAVYDIDCDYIAGRVKERLSDIFGEESPCLFVRGKEVKRIKIYELDRQKTYDLTCGVAVEEDEFLKKDRFDFADLEELIKILRAPGGCPWDRAQTSESIKTNMIEEAYELVDAIEKGDTDGMEEETGDVLLQAVFHSVIQKERGGFTSSDALTRVVKKLIFRHSHIFGKDKAGDSAEALGVWEKNKQKEKGQSTFGESVASVPSNFPACMRAQKVQKRASKSGMDFLSAVSASESLADEVTELLDAIVEGKGDIFEEAGDVLFSAVNVCRHAGVDCEEALRASIKKFSDRFIECERQIIADGKDITQLNELELNVYWERAKNALKAN